MKKPYSILNTLTKKELLEVNKRIIYLRTDILHLTQAEFSSKLNISQSYISLLESGKKALTKSAYEKIIATFSINFEWLLYGNDTDNIFIETTTTSTDNFISWYDSLSLIEKEKINDLLKELSIILQKHPFN